MTLHKKIIPLTALLLSLSLGSCGAQENETIQVSDSDVLWESSGLFTERDLTQIADLSEAVDLELRDGQEVLIEEEGIYVLSGTVRNTVIIVDADNGAKVQLVLDDLSITNEDTPAIYVKSADKVFITTKGGESSLAVTGQYESDGDTNLDAVIFSRDDLVINGTGTLEITSAEGNGISGKDDLKITGGSLIIDAADDGLEANDSIRICDGIIAVTAKEDTLHCENDDDPLAGFIYIGGGTLDLFAGDDAVRGTSAVQIDGGTINIHNSSEGIEATQILINGGTIDIYATDDGINATAKSPLDVIIEVYGGDISIEMAMGDTDGFDSNGEIYIYGGTIDVTGQSTFDADGTAQLIGGEVIVNGAIVTELPSERQGGGRRHR